MVTQKLNKGLELYRKGSKLLEDTGKHLDKSINQIWKWSYAGDLLLDLVGFIPLIGDGVKVVKKIPFKEIGDSIKNGIKEIPNILKNAKNGIDNFVSKFSKKGVQ